MKPTDNIEMMRVLSSYVERIQLREHLDLTGALSYILQQERPDASIVSSTLAHQGLMYFVFYTKPSENPPPCEAKPSGESATRNLTELQPTKHPEAQSSAPQPPTQLDTTD